MNEQTEQNINQAIDWLQHTGAQIQDFAIEQAPLYCREVIAWQFWSSAISGGAGITVTLIAVVAFIKFARWMKEDDGEPNARTIPAVCIAILGMIVGPILAMENIPQAIKAAVSPRLVIVEHLRGLK